MKMIRKRPYGLLFALTFRANFRLASVIVLLLIVPIVLGLTAGEGNRLNYSNELVLAVADEDDTEESRELIDSLVTRGWVLHPMTVEEAEPVVERGDAAGLLRIGAGFSDYINGGDKDTAVTFETSEDSLIQSTVRQTLVLRIETMRSNRLLKLRSAAEHLDIAGEIQPGHESRFDADVELYARTQAALPLTYVGRTTERVRHTIVVSDLSLLVLYLTALAVILWVKMKQPAIESRLKSIPGAKRANFILTYAAYLLAGALVIFVFLVTMRLSMGDSVSVLEFLRIVTFYGLLLVMTSYLRYLDAEIGLYLGLMAVFLLALGGGAIIPLPSRIFTNIAQYTPHGWIYGVSIGYPVIPAFWLWILTIFLLFLAETRPRQKRVTQKNRTA
jgi:hypothetical protein